MKRTLAFVFIFLFSVLTGSLLINLTAANPDVLVGPPSPPSVHVSLDTHNPTLTITVRADSLKTVRGYYVNPSFSPIQVWVDRILWTELPGSQGPIQISLSGLSDGWHKVHVTVAANYNYDVSYSSKGSSNTIEVLIDNSQPVISNLAVAQVAFKSDIQANFRVMDYSLSWLGYSLDEKEDVTIDWNRLVKSVFGQWITWNGNITLNGLSVGEHSLVLFAKDTSGNLGNSEPITFNITETSLTTTSHSTTLPTTAISIAIIASVALVSFGLVACFVKSNREINK